MPHNMLWERTRRQIKQLKLLIGHKQSRLISLAGRLYWTSLRVEPDKESVIAMWRDVRIMKEQAGLLRDLAWAIQREARKAERMIQKDLIKRHIIGP